MSGAGGLALRLAGDCGCGMWQVASVVIGWLVGWLVAVFLHVHSAEGLAARLG